MKTRLKDGFQKLNIELSDFAVENYMKYMQLLIQWNEKMNLTAITEPEDIVTLHFLDSVTPVSAKLIPQKSSVIDIGSGAGFPGLPIKFAREDISLTLLDALAKRLKFIEDVLEKTNTTGVELLHSRAEDGGRDKKYREKYDIAVSRAVASMPVLCEYCLPYVRIGGKFIALKGPNVSEELNTNAIKTLGGRLVDILNVEIPFTDRKHTIVVVEKISACPSAYPRKAGSPSKAPLK